MADEVPQSLKRADINLYKTATRGAQLQTVKPIIAYWCEYWVVNQILAKSLHSSDADILNYTTGLMDKLERTKTEYASEDAITDDIAAQAYIEQFAQETLDRAERVIKAGKVTLQTASTFDAALTFFNLVNIWGPADNETQQKTKYAKWNAARITKAIKEGKDPNESNPKKEDLPAQPPPPDSKELEAYNLDSSDAPLADAPRPATVEDAPETDDTGRDSAGVSPPHSPALAAQPPSGPDEGELQLPSAPGYGDEAAPDTPGYFDPPPELPSPISPPAQDPEYRAQDADALPSPSTSGLTPSPPAASPPVFAPSNSPPLPPPPQTRPTPVSPPADTSRSVVSAPPPAQPFLQAAVPAPVAASQVPQQVVGNFVADDAAMALAQKHARWAISALNFEDVPTAVRELRRALETLGAT
ncbi:Vta1 like-domain-containing protein [Coniella lustricola]|uniref:Vta1 like-domain-containing protein n=1 Tax=Coniella lustricola TaxID=2025994 RepID=A0A2T3A5V1_9PEZI|nr:Vta1 like-domain-containing protein [Coniella lustricola]